jgi:hypothetical protein
VEDIKVINQTKHFYARDNSILRLFKDYNIKQLLGILPIQLRTQTMYFIYKEAIDSVKILQNKNQIFYSQYLMLFTPMRIKSGTVLLAEGG